MELVQQHRLPDALQVLVRVGVRVARHPYGGGGGPQLGLAQQGLAVPVALLGLGLRGVRTAVQLQVQLARPHRRVRVLRVRLLEERLGLLDLDPRRALQIAQPGGAGQHLAGGAATAVAPPEGCERPRTPALLPVVAGGVRHLLAAEVGVVGVDGREVGEDTGAVDALPPEGVVREPVDLAPGDLLRQEPRRAGQLHELGHGRRVAEGVRQPHLLRLDAELVQEELLPVQELPGHRLAADHVGVRLHPHAADRHELPGLDLRLDPCEHLGPVLLDPRELLRLRHGEDELGVRVHQVDHVRGRTGHLADRLAQRPQPGRVDVRVADRADAVRRGVGRGREDVRELLARPRGGAGNVLEVDGVQGPFDGAQDAVPARVGHVQLPHQAAQHLQILDQLPDLGLEDDEVHPPQPVQRRVARGEPVALVGGPVVRQYGVGGRLHVQLDRLVAGGGLGDAHPVVARVQALHRLAVRPVDQALALETGHVRVEAEVQYGFDGAPGPLRRDLPGDPEPGGAPGRPPPLPNLRRFIDGGQSLGGRHRLARRLPALDRQRHGAAADGGRDAVVQDTA